MLQYTTLASTNETCLGAANGTVTVSIQGGSSPYTGIASNNNSGLVTTHLIQNDSIISGITSGVYTMSVTDVNNCSSVLQQGGVNQQTISTGIVVSSSISPNVSQFGGPADTSTSPVVPGGEYSNYNGYLNLNCNIPSKLVSAVVYAGTSNTITFELRDNTGSVLDDTTITVQIGEQRLYLDFDIPVGTDFELGVSGGNTQLYRNNAGSGNSMAYPYNIGNSVSITSANNNNSQQYYYFYYDLEIASPASIACWNGNDGALQVLNPDPIFSYVWEEVNNPGVIVDTGIQADSLYAGNYILLAGYTDSLGVTYPGCTDTSQIAVVVQPSQILISSLVDDVSCFGGSDGEISLTISGGTPGTPAYTHSWSNGLTTNPATGLQVGTFTDTVRDGNGCEVITTVTINEPLDLISTISASDYNGYGVSCFGGNNGSVNLTIDQNTGTAPFTYSWNPGGQTNMNLSNRTAGQYTVTITDAKGCAYTNNTTLTEPTQLLVSPIISSNYNGAHISCAGYSDGEATITTSGGIQPHTVLWNNSSTANQISDLLAGTYTATVTDKNGCISSADITLVDPLDLELTLDVRDSLTFNVSCFGVCDGWALATPLGGTTGISGIYTYLWSDGQSSSLAEGLCAGMAYTVTVTDANGCDESNTTMIFTEPPAFEATVVTTNYYGPEKPPLNIHFADSTYLSTIHPMLFTWIWPPDSLEEQFSWEFGNPGMNISHSFTEIGRDTVHLIVLNKETGCTDKLDFVIDVQGLKDIKNVFTPNGDDKNDVFKFDNHGMDILSIMVFNRWGQKVYETDLNNAEWNGEDMKGNQEAAGTYFYVLTAQGKDGYRYEEKGAVILIRE